MHKSYRNVANRQVREQIKKNTVSPRYGNIAVAFCQGLSCTFWWPKIKTNIIVKRRKYA